MKHIIFNQLQEQPWKNGQGVTKQIAIYPPNGDLTSFQWRISAATIKDTGPFSQFNHVTRSLALLTGEKIVLTIDGKNATLYKNGTPLSFDGGAKTSLIECTTAGLDFGVMTHNHHTTHTLVQTAFKHGDVYQRQATTTLVLALDACIINNVCLNPFDSLLFLRDDEPTLTITTASLSSTSIPLLITEIANIK